MSNFPWWKSGIIYQIYPRSYQDTTGNGVGDLQGILSRLDYIQQLGVSCIWLSPIYPSPMHDFGYDVADYTDINSLFGTIEDFDALLDGVHERGMKLMLDFVPNHTSSEHKWFQEARKGKDNPYRDYYIWQDPKENGDLPTNWTSFFGGPAWTYDEVSDQYYMHQFVPEQPELNYDNPEVMKGMKQFMKFWLEKGVDGFRLDVIWLLKKDQRFLDEPINSSWGGVRPWEKTLKVYTSDVEGNHKLVQQYRDLLDQYEDRVFLGEIYLPFEQLMKYYNEIQLPSNTVLLTTPWEASQIKPIVREYFNKLPDDAWPNWQLGNHDQHRIASRIGRDLSRVAMMFLLTIKGTPITYYGEEIGMENVKIPPDMVRDPPAVNEPEHADEIGRDPERTPMQWDTSPNAGFTEPGVEPWLPVGKNTDVISVEAQDGRKGSMLEFYKTLTHLRSSYVALAVGDYRELDLGILDLFVYTRQFDNDQFLIVLNLGAQEFQLDLEDRIEYETAYLEINTQMDRNGFVDLSSLEIFPNEGLVIHLDHEFGNNSS